MRAPRRTWLLGALALACSAGEGPTPEPSLTTPGSFVAVDAGHGIELWRVVRALRDEYGDVLLFVSIYVARPASFEEARRLAAGPQLPVLLRAVQSRNAVLALPHAVVGFRTLTPEEENGF